MIIAPVILVKAKMHCTQWLEYINTAPAAMQISHCILTILFWVRYSLSYISDAEIKCPDQKHTGEEGAYLGYNFKF